MRLTTIEQHILDQQRKFPGVSGEFSGLLYDIALAAKLVSADDDLVLVSRNAQSIRFHADDEQLRPMGRATSGVIGMRFDRDDELLAMEVVRPAADLLTGNGFLPRGHAVHEVGDVVPAGVELDLCVCQVRPLGLLNLSRPRGALVCFPVCF